jgi:hypothetical protein
MSKELRKPEPLGKKKATAFTASTVLAAVSLLSVSLGVSGAAPAEDSGSGTNTRDAKAADGKLAEAIGTQDTLQRNQLKSGRQNLQSNQIKMQGLRSDQNKQQLQSNQVKMQGLRSDQNKQQLQSNQVKTRMRSTQKGKHYPKATLRARKAGKEQQEFLRSNQIKQQLQSNEQK